MTLATPNALLLLLLLPPLLWLGWPRQRFRRARDATATLLRALLLLCIVLALSGAQLSQSADRLAVVFLIDVSDSLGPELQEAQLAWVEQAMAAMGPDDLAGIVAFGAQPLHRARALRHALAGRLAIAARARQHGPGGGHSARQRAAAR